MKRVVSIILAIIAISSFCRAQDTVQYGDSCYLFNERTYFTQRYHGLPLWNMMCCHVSDINHDFVVRYHTPSPDRALQVYGIAITVDTSHYSIDEYDFEVNLAIRENESLMFIDSTTWKKGSDVRKHFTYSIPPVNGQVYEQTVPVFEIYFDAPITVNDTFFVGYRLPLPGGSPNAFYRSYDSSSTYYLFYAHTNPTIPPVPMDTVWGSIFPIIQPNWYCAAPERPRTVLHTTTNTVDFEVDYTAGDSMQLCIVRAGQPANSGQFYNITDSMFSIVVPDSGHFKAMVRRFCPRYSMAVPSDWSAAADLFIIAPLGIPQADDGGWQVYVQPGRVVVMGTEGEAVRVYDMMGRLAAATAVTGGTVAIPLPMGVYVVRCGDRAGQKVVVTR